MLNQMDGVGNPFCASDPNIVPKSHVEGRGPALVQGADLGDEGAVQQRPRRTAHRPDPQGPADGAPPLPLPTPPPSRGPSRQTTIPGGAPIL